MPVRDCKPSIINFFTAYEPALKLALNQPDRRQGDYEGHYETLQATKGQEFINECW